MYLFKGEKGEGKWGKALKGKGKRYKRERERENKREKERVGLRFVYVFVYLHDTKSPKKNSSNNYY